MENAPAPSAQNKNLPSAEPEQQPVQDLAFHGPDINRETGSYETSATPETPSRISETLGRLALIGTQVGDSVKKGAVRTNEALENASDYTGIAIYGLYRSAAIRKAHRKAVALQQKDRDLNVNKESALAVTERRLPNSSLRPTTARQQRHAAKASKMQGKAANRQAGEQYRLGVIYGKDISDPNQKSKVKAAYSSQAISRSEKKLDIKAGKRFRKNVKYIDKLSGYEHPDGYKPEGKVHDMKTGENRTAKATKKSVERHRNKIISLSRRANKARQIQLNKKAAIQERQQVN